MDTMIHNSIKVSNDDKYFPKRFDYANGICLLSAKS